MTAETGAKGGKRGRKKKGEPSVKSGARGADGSLGGQGEEEEEDDVDVDDGLEDDGEKVDKDAEKKNLRWVSRSSTLVMIWHCNSQEAR